MPINLMRMNSKIIFYWHTLKKMQYQKLGYFLLKQWCLVQPSVSQGTSHQSYFSPTTLHKLQGFNGYHDARIRSTQFLLLQTKAQTKFKFTFLPATSLQRPCNILLTSHSSNSQQSPLPVASQMPPIRVLVAF